MCKHMRKQFESVLILQNFLETKCKYVVPDNHTEDKKY